ncbi:MAG: glycoside hydrolase [Mangrovibacterium sp.]
MRFSIIHLCVLTGMLSGLLTFNTTVLKAADWRVLADLRGAWSFTVGDDPAWSDPETVTADWDRMNVPGRWENHYPGYNGYAWYRRSFSLRTLPDLPAVTLFLGFIDDVDEVFVNGRKIGQTGTFFPAYKTAYNVERCYRVPVSLLKKSGNVIAVRVYDQAMEGGIVSAGNFGFYMDADQLLLALDLSGNWKFSTEDFGNMHSPNCNDTYWNELIVPGIWENQGFPGYDGKAFYRRRFSLPAFLARQELYLVLGRIDDYDRVYLNGMLIGRVEELDQYSRFSRGEAYRLFRIYLIPADVLRSKNLVSLEITDTGGEGGIYEGPVGLAGREVAERLSAKYANGSIGTRNFSFWEELLKLFNDKR